MFAAITYASPSAFRSTRDSADLSIAASAVRPVRFSGLVRRHGFPLRIALRALGAVIWSQEMWADNSTYQSWTLDPVITVHPDRLWFEAFSQDMSAYAALIVDPAVFEVEGDVAYGTTNIDFTAWLWGAIGEMRTSRETRFRVGAEGFEVATEGAGGRFQQKVDLPDSWVRGFLQVQGAMALPGTRLRVRPVDLLAALRFLKFNKAKVSPRALRYEMLPGEAARLVVEPWDHVVPLEGASHGYVDKRVIRTWGRRRLNLIEPLLPFAEQVDVYLKGRAMPSFYAVKLPGMTFLLGLSGHADAGFATGGFDSGGSRATNNDLQERVIGVLKAAFHASTTEIAGQLGLSEAVAGKTLIALSYGGRVMYDVETRRWRHRELFNPPVDTAHFFPPDPRREEATQLVQTGVLVRDVLAEEQRKQKRYWDPRTGGTIERELLFRQWRIAGDTGGCKPEIVVNPEERIIFGQCDCAFFKDNLMIRGPCPHMLALFEASATARLQTSLDSPAPGIQ